MTGNSAGVVVAHNFMTDMHYTVSHWMMAGLQGSHDAGTGMNLFEGNVGNAFVMDTYHGTGNLATLFRNRLTGTEGTKTANTIPVNIFAYNRFVNVIGNVLGMPGHHHVYESSRSSSRGRPTQSIYVLGYSGVLESTPASLPYDPAVVSTVLGGGTSITRRGRRGGTRRKYPKTSPSPPAGRCRPRCSWPLDLAGGGRSPGQRSVPTSPAARTRPATLIGFPRRCASRPRQGRQTARCASMPRPAMAARGRVSSDGSARPSLVISHSQCSRMDTAALPA